MSECLGMTLAQAQAMAIMVAANFGGSTTDADWTLETLLTLGWLKYCSVHPDRIIMSKRGWVVRRMVMESES